MNLRPIAAAGLALALVGCNGEDMSKPPVVASRKPDPGVVTARYDEAMHVAAKSLRSNDAATAVAQLETAVKLDPRSGEALLLLARATTTRGLQLTDGPSRQAMFLRSAQAMRTLKDLSRTLGPEEQAQLATSIYNEARAFALQGQPDRAIASLVEAVDAGFADAKSIAGDHDSDLASIRDRPEFAALADRARIATEKTAARMREAEARRASETLASVKDGLRSFKPFPFDFALPDLDGKSVKLADFKGKVTIVDFWGTWCPPCKQEIPHFVALRSKYKDKGLEVVGINYEKVPDDRVKATIAAYLKENAVPYACVIGDDKTLATIPDFSAYPTTLFIDRAGKVRLTHVGYAPLPVLEAVVLTLLDEDAGKTAGR